MKIRLGISHYLLLPTLLALGGTLTIMVWSLYSIKDQSQERTTELAQEMAILNEVASIDLMLIENHQNVTEALHAAASGKIDEAMLYRNHSRMINNLAEIENRMGKVLHLSEAQSISTSNAEDMLNHLHRYRASMVMASDSAVINVQGAAVYLNVAQEHMIEFSRHRQTLSKAITEHAKSHLGSSIGDFDTLFARTLVGSLIGLILMASLILLSSRSLRDRLDTLSSALTTLRRQGQVPLVMSDVEALRHDKIGEIGEMATAVLTFRQSIIDRQMALVELTHYKERLEELVEERTLRLKASEARLAEAQSIAHMGNWDWDIRSGELYWSDEIYRIFGMEPGKGTISVQDFISAIHPEDLPLLRDEIDRAIVEPDYQYNIDHRIVLHDGTIRHVQNVGKMVRQEGVPLRLIGVIHDVTERVAAREEMELYRLMIEKSSDPVFLIDIEDQFRMVYVNQAAVDHYGAPREEILKWRLPDWDPNFTYADLPAHLERVRNREGEGILLETLHHIKGGEIVPVEVTLNLTHYKGKMFHFGYIKNIAARKRDEQQLQLAKQQAEEATRTKSEFLANMSHEIRTPMNAVINLSRLTLQTELNDKQRDYIEKVVRAGETLLALINDVLDFSKIEAGKMSVDAVPFSLERMVEETCSLLSHRGKGPEVELLVELSSRLPDRLVGDPLRIGQVLTNLLSNALKFTERGMVLLGISLVERRNGSAVLEFCVCDTGIGISREQQMQLFRPFAQADGSTSRRYGGTGLGLSISQNLLRLMGSELHLESSPGQGSSFTFNLTLPLADINSPPEMIRCQMGGERSLIVDDNATARDILREMLEEMGGNVTECESGDIAISELRRACHSGVPYTQAYIDWRMPGLDGFALIARIRDDYAINPKPLAILVTAYGSDVMRSQAIEAGFTEVLDKPIIPTKLCRLMSYDHGRTKEKERSDLVPYSSRLDELRALGGRRVLLVEDNEINQEIATELLSDLNIDVGVAPDGNAALAALENGNYDLVLMDLQMPGMDGYETTRRIRSQERWHNLPIIAMTAHAMEEERKRCLDAGMNDHLAKPINVGLLYDALLRWITPGNALTLPSYAPTQEVVIPAELPGIDITSGLERVARNRALYHSLLLKFYANQPEATRELVAALANGDSERAKRLAHTLKGVAGNLGADGVLQAAAALEQGLAAGMMERAGDLLTALQGELDRVMAGLATLDTGEHQNEALVCGEGQVQCSQIALLLRKLAVELENDLREALCCYEMLQPLLVKNGQALAGERLGVALANYDIDEALNLLRDIATEMDMEL